jgi:hypothetical protein
MPVAVMHVVDVLAIARIGGLAVSGVDGAGVGVSEVSGVAMPGVTMPTVPAMSIMSHVGETADCHRGEPCTTQR